MRIYVCNLTIIGSDDGLALCQPVPFETLFSFYWIKYVAL